MSSQYLGLGMLFGDSSIFTLRNPNRPVITLEPMDFVRPALRGSKPHKPSGKDRSKIKRARKQKHGARK